MAIMVLADPDRHSYSVGWITILSVEFTAARAMFDGAWKCPPKPHDDPNMYATGVIKGHNVVIACAGEAGPNAANHCATHLMRTFPHIRIGLLSGIGGGVPSSTADVRLGDVIVSRPGPGHGGVVYYDAGKLTKDGFQPTGHLDRPPLPLRNASIFLQSNMDLNDPQFWDTLNNVKPAHLASKTGLSDILYEAGDLEKQILREPRQGPVVHYGLIASGSWVIKTSGSRRDDLVKQVHGEVLCFEMEACGLMNTFPCLVVRGVSDYCDSHKNDGWHKYASISAACYCKCLLDLLSPDQIEQEPTAAYVTNRVR
jgi:nucleoside phosphorylase